MEASDALLLLMTAHSRVAVARGWGPAVRETKREDVLLQQEKRWRCCTVAVQAGIGEKWKCLKSLVNGLETVWRGWWVAHTGFEPVISALRGRCPRPLDECASLSENSFFRAFTPRTFTGYIIALLCVLVNRPHSVTFSFDLTRGCRRQITPFRRVFCAQQPLFVAAHGVSEHVLHAPLLSEVVQSRLGLCLAFALSGPMKFDDGEHC
jgi:hypothetical protein